MLLSLFVAGQYWLYAMSMVSSCINWEICQDQQSWYRTCEPPIGLELRFHTSWLKSIRIFGESGASTDHNQIKSEQHISLGTSAFSDSVDVWKIYCVLTLSHKYYDFPSCANSSDLHKRHVRLTCVCITNFVNSFVAIWTCSPRRRHTCAATSGSPHITRFVQ